MRVLGQKKLERGAEPIWRDLAFNSILVEKKP